MRKAFFAVLRFYQSRPSDSLHDYFLTYLPCIGWAYYSFDKYGAELDIPPILIAAIAMQESSCNKDSQSRLSLSLEDSSWGSATVAQAVVLTNAFLIL